MKVTYIYQSGFFVQHEKACMLFDYWRGKLPEPMDVPLFIFVSHGHKDHFSRDIFKYGSRWKKVKYIISDDINPESLPAEAMKDMFIASPNMNYELSLGEANISFRTLRSTDMGNAYLVSIEDKKIYHAGDLHLWLWREDEKEDADMKAAFEKAIETLRGINLDAAFIPLDPRQADDTFLGLDYIAHIAHIKRIYPMHFWGKYSTINKLMADSCSETYRDRICCIRKEGQTDEI